MGDFGLEVGSWAALRWWWGLSCLVVFGVVGIVGRGRLFELLLSSCASLQRWVCKSFTHDSVSRWILFHPSEVRTRLAVLDPMLAFSHYYASFKLRGHLWCWHLSLYQFTWLISVRTWTTYLISHILGIRGHESSWHAFSGCLHSCRICYSYRHGLAHCAYTYPGKIQWNNSREAYSDQLERGWIHFLPAFCGAIRATSNSDSSWTCDCKPCIWTFACRSARFTCAAAG